jgi:Flp pilus assembly protein TadB
MAERTGKFVHLASGAGHFSSFGWVLGYVIGIVVVLVVVALVVPILRLAYSIGKEAPKINDSLGDAVHNTAALQPADDDGGVFDRRAQPCQRGRARLGG